MIFHFLNALFPLKKMEHVSAENTFASIAEKYNDFYHQKRAYARVIEHHLQLPHNHHEGSVYAGSAIRDDERNRYRRMAWAFFQKIATENSCNQQSENLMVTLIDLLKKIGEKTNFIFDEQTTVRDCIMKSHLFSMIEYQNGSAKTVDHLAPSFDMHRRIWTILMLSGYYSIGDADQSNHYEAVKKIVMNQMTTKEICSIQSHGYPETALSLFLGRIQDLNDQTTIHSCTHAHLSTSHQDPGYLTLILLLMGEIWYLSFLNQQNENAQMPQYQPWISVDIVMKKYLVYFQEYLFFDEDYHEVVGFGEPAFGNEQYRFNYATILIHHLRNQFMDAGESAVLDYMAWIRHPEENEISCNHGMMLRILDLYFAKYLSQNTVEEKQSKQEYQKLQSLFDPQRQGDVILRSLLLHFFKDQVNYSSEYYSRYHPSEEHSEFLADPQYQKVLDLMLKDIVGWSHHPSYQSLFHAHEIEQLKKSPSSYKIIAFCQTHSLPRWSESVYALVRKDLKLLKHFQESFVQEALSRTYWHVRFKKSIFDLEDFCNYAAKVMPQYSAVEIAYALFSALNQNSEPSTAQMMRALDEMISQDVFKSKKISNIFETVEVEFYWWQDRPYFYREEDLQYHSARSQQAIMHANQDVLDQTLSLVNEFTSQRIFLLGRPDHLTNAQCQQIIECFSVFPETIERLVMFFEPIFLPRLIQFLFQFDSRYQFDCQSDEYAFLFHHAIYYHSEPLLAFLLSPQFQVDSKVILSECVQIFTLRPWSQVTSTIMNALKQSIIRDSSIDLFSILNFLIDMMSRSDHFHLSCIGPITELLDQILQASLTESQIFKNRVNGQEEIFNSLRKFVSQILAINDESIETMTTFWVELLRQQNCQMKEELMGLIEEIVLRLLERQKNLDSIESWLKLMGPALTEEFLISLVKKEVVVWLSKKSLMRVLDMMDRAYLEQDSNRASIRDLLFQHREQRQPPEQIYFSPSLQNRKRKTPSTPEISPVKPCQLFSTPPRKK